jgi:hypothetical protein
MGDSEGSPPTDDGRSAAGGGATSATDGRGKIRTVLHVIKIVASFVLKSFVSSDPPGRAPAVPRGSQFLYMFFISASGGLVIHEYAPKDSIPPYFWSIEAIIWTICALGLDVLYDLVQGSPFIGSLEATPSVPEFKKWRDRYGHLFIKIGVVLNMVALWIAVKHTGGALKSPFVPMLAGPAIFGAFVAQTKRGIFELVFLALLGILAIDRWLSGRIPGEQWRAYYAPQVALLVAAGAISMGVLWRDEVLRTRRVERLKGDVLGLDDEALLRLARQVLAAVRTEVSLAQARDSETPPDLSQQ